MKGNNMEYMILFVASVAIGVLSGYLYLKKEDTAYDKLIVQVQDLRGAVESLDKRVAGFATVEVVNELAKKVTAVEVDIVERKLNIHPQTMNVVMKSPVKVLYKKVEPATLPGLTPQLKSQVKKLSQ